MKTFIVKYKNNDVQSLYTCISIVISTHFSFFLPKKTWKSEFILWFIHLIELKLIWSAILLIFNFILSHCQGHLDVVFSRIRLVFLLYTSSLKDVNYRIFRVLVDFSYIFWQFCVNCFVSHWNIYSLAQHIFSMLSMLCMYVWRKYQPKDGK